MNIDTALAFMIFEPEELRDHIASTLGLKFSLSSLQRMKAVKNGDIRLYPLTKDEESNATLMISVKNDGTDYSESKAFTLGNLQSIKEKNEYGNFATYLMVAHITDYGNTSYGNSFKMAIFGKDIRKNVQAL